MSYQQTLAVDTVLIDEFRILGLLGTGGFANTYLAHDLTLGREVAIKEYFPSDLAIRVGNSERVEVKSEAQASQFDWALKRFVREAKTLAKFRHPSVVRVFRVFNANETAYIVLEFVRGSNMETWLKSLGRLPTQEQFDVLLPPLLDALEVVHGAGILHRDIKPANVYIRAADHTPVLLDFGAARYSTSADIAGTTAAIVSKGYSPHEAYSTDSRLQGPWTDIYGLAATVYRALTGSAPPESTTRVLDDACLRAVDLPCASQYRRSFLAGIDRALAVMPRDRPQSIADWRHDIVTDIVSQPPAATSNSEVETVIEWRPISVSPSSTPASNGRISGASTGGTWRPAEDSEPLTHPRAAPSVHGAGLSQRPTEIIGVSASSRQSLLPPSATVQPTSPRGHLLLGIALSIFGVGALAAQFLPSGSDAPDVPSEVTGVAVPGGDGGTPESGTTPAVTTTASDEDERRKKAAAEARERELAEARRQREEDAARRKAEADKRESELAEARRLREVEAARLREAADQRERDRIAAEARRRQEIEEAARQKAEAEKRERELAEARRLRELEAARLKAEADKRERERAAEEARKRQEEEMRRKSEADQRERDAAAARQRQEQEEAARQKAAAEKADAEKREREAAAERQRQAEETARQKAEAEQREREAAEARQRQEEEAARQKAEAEKRERELAEARQQREQEEARQKAEADAAARKSQEIKVAARTDSDDPSAGQVILPQTEPALALARGTEMKSLQQQLKSSNCYDGPVDGQIQSTQAAIKTLEDGIDGEGEPIDLASADVEEFDDWMTWFRSLKDIQCEDEVVEEPAPRSSKGATAPTRRKKVKTRDAQPVKRHVPRKTRKKSPPKSRASAPKKSTPKRAAKSSPRRSSPARRSPSTASSSGPGYTGAGGSLLRGGR